MYRQATLLGSVEPRTDASFGALQRRQLDAGTWVDIAPEWLTGSDVVFDTLAEVLPWRQRDVWMYGRLLAEPRLNWWWQRSLGDAGPSPFGELGGLLDEIGDLLGRRYGVAFDSIGFNWYRDGDDSVAWHSDTRGPPVLDPTIAIVSVGSRRPFRLRPKAGGRSVSFDLGAGDLLVMGGSCQHDWEHTVPKRQGAGPRISITYRHSGNR